LSGGKSILVIGGGIVGLSSAYYAAQRGHQVTVIDRRSADGDCCSLGNAGLVVPSHIVPLSAPGTVAMGLRMMRDPSSPFYVKPRLSWELLSWGWRFWRNSNQTHVVRSAPLLRDLNLASGACYRELAGLCANEFELNSDGLLMLCETELTLEHEQAAAKLATELGMESRTFNARETAQREPGIRMAGVGSVFYPMDGHLTPQKAVAFLQRKLAELGVKLIWDTEIDGFRSNAGKIEAVRTAIGELKADEFVICAGSWSSGLAKELGLRIPMQAGKGYSLTLPEPRHKPRGPAILVEARVAVTPMGQSLRFAGTMELAGMDASINPQRVAGIVESVPRYYPDFTAGDFENVQPWCGLRPCSPDGLPYLGRTRRFENLCLATGHAMMGLSLGPISGKLIAELVSGQLPSIDIRLLDPDRYA
jgi:D-amino-acid dehydrogenase